MRTQREPGRWPTIEEQHARKCLHFNGVMNATCDAGVEYATVRDTTQPPGYKLPCFKDDRATTYCGFRRFPTPEETAQHAAEVREAGQRFVEKLQGNIYPHCDRPITRKQQVGRCVYAEPCGHRLYQGRLAKGE